jgi:hypothetical protein
MTGQPMTWRLSAALLLLLGAVGAAPLDAHDELRFVGTVVKMDGASKRLAVTYKEAGQDEVVEVTLTAKTEITRDRKAIPASELRPGVFVVVDALGCEDEYEGVAVRIVPPPAQGR